MTSPRALAVCALLLLGCARDPEMPVPLGRACDTDAECNRAPDGGTAVCGGYLRLCIAGRCEAADAGSLLVLCRDR